MPKLEPKIVQKELEKGLLRPVYFLAGPERLKARELVRRIVRAALRGEEPNDFNFEKFDSSEAGLEGVLDAAQSRSLMGGLKVVLARNAEEIRNLDPLAAYLEGLESSDPVKPEELSSVLVLVSKSLDGRKKASRVVSDRAALVPCEEIEEHDREPWIELLAKRRGIALRDSERLALRGLDPWTLDIVDQEISKLELAGTDEALRADALRSGISAYAQDNFIDALFTRDRKRALSLVHHFSGDMDVQLPFLGLVAWNFRQLKLYVMEQETRVSAQAKRAPALQGKLDRWCRYWDRPRLQQFEHALFEIDFSLKNTRLLGVALWTSLILGKGQP